jgi:proteasome activator subunit 4
MYASACRARFRTKRMLKILHPRTDILTARDPRRNQPLVDYITSLRLDEDSAEAFNESKKQDLVGTAMKALGWHFSPWAPTYLEMYSANITHPYQEVRGAVADNLRALCELRQHPSFTSVEALIRDSQRIYGELGSKSLVAVDEAYEARIDEFGRKLAAWRAERKPASEGTQMYDKASMTSTSSSCVEPFPGATLTTSMPGQS